MLGSAKTRRSVGASVAAVALTGALSLGLVTSSANTAQAVIPLVPVAILGATGAAGGVTLSGAAITLGITTAVAGLAMAATQPGNLQLLENWVNDLMGHDKDPATGENVDTTRQKQYEPVPTREGDADPLFYDYAWVNPDVSVVSASELLVNNVSTGRVRFRLNAIGSQVPSNYGLGFVTATCRDPKNPSKPPLTGSKPHISGLVQGTAGYNEANFSFTCASVGLPPAAFNNGGYAGQIVEYTVRPATTKEKLTIMKESDGFYDRHRWANTHTHWKDSTFEYADPQYRVELTCVSPEGVRTKISHNTDIGPEGLVNVPSCKALGHGFVAESMVVGFADGDKIKQPIFTSTPVYDDAYFECDPVFGKICKFEIRVDGQPCVVGSPACASWAGLHRINPARVQCMYGGRVVDISGCAILEGAYVTGGTPATKNNTDGNPDTWDEPAKVPYWIPHGYPQPGADPAPDPEIKPGPPPQPEPHPDTPFEPNPEPENPTEPNPEPENPTNPETPPNPEPVFPRTGDNPSDNCVAPKWEWNPVHWVKNPVVCALVEAFVPKMDIKARSDALRDVTLTKPPLNLISPPVTGPSGGGCPNWVVSIPGEFSKNVVCGSSFTAAIVGARYAIFGMVVTAMVWPLVRSIWYAAIPILRVTPTGGK